MNKLRTSSAMQMVAVLTIAVLAVSIVQFADAARPKFIAPLSGTGNDKGKAVFTTENAGVNRLDVQVENLEPNTTYAVVIAGNPTVITVTTDALGNASAQFLGSDVPSITTGSMIEITSGTTTVLAGIFAPKL